MLAAKQPLVVPMLLRLSQFKLRSIVVLVVSKQKGITLVFKTDPLQNVDINSTFDSIAVIQKFIQREIEGQLRQMFREDLPGIIHQLSQQWVKAKVEAPYLAKRPTMPSSSTSFTPELSVHNVSKLPSSTSKPTLPYRRASLVRPPSRSAESRRSAQTTRSAPVSPPSEMAGSDYESSHPDLEYFDPTYGLRPEGVPSKSAFQGFGQLFSPARGLADLAEEEESEEELPECDDESVEYDMVDWKGGMNAFSPATSDSPESGSLSTPEFESIPAVGGGLVTRPRIYHSQSMVQPSPDGSTFSTSRRQSRPYSLDGMSMYSAGIATPDSYRRRQLGDLATTRIPTLLTEQDLNSPTAFFKTNARPPTPESLEIQSSSRASSDHPPDPDARQSQPRRLSISTNLESMHTSNSRFDADPRIVLRPNNSLHHLSSLSHSNHTLSPYTRSMQHFTVRSVPPRTSSYFPSLGSHPPKAKRKRTFKLGSSKPAENTAAVEDVTGIPTPQTDLNAPSSLSPNYQQTDLDLSDMDRYFAPHDNNPHPPPRPAMQHYNHSRLRRSYVHPDP